MADAVKRGGIPPMIMPHTPASGALAAGEVVLIGNTAGITCGIATLPVANNAEGVLEIGGGEYDVTMLTNMTAGTKVYWDTSINKVVATSTNMSLFGYLTTGGTGANTVVRAFHWPYV